MASDIDIKARLSLATDAFKAALADANSGVHETAGKIEEAFQGMNHSANIAIATIGGLGIGALATATSFDHAFVQVRQAVNGTDADFDNIRAGILDLSKTTPESATNLAKVAAAVGDLGVKAPQVVEVTKAMEEFGAATGQSAIDAEQQLGELSKRLNLTPDEIENLGASIVGTADHFQTSDKKVAALADSLAETGQAAGLSETQIIGLAGSLASVGVDAEKGGLAVSQTLAAMSKAAAEGGKALDTFAAASGLTADQFKEKFQKDAAGALMDFLGSLRATHAAGGDTLAMLHDVGLGGRLVRDSLLLAAGAADRMGDGTSAATKALTDHSAIQKEASRENESSAAKFEIMKNKVQDLAIDVGEKLLPVVMKLLDDFIVPSIKWLGDHKDVVIAVGAAILAMAFAVKAVNLGLEIYRAGAAAVKILTNLWTGEQWSLNVAMEANPIGFIIAAIAALAVAIYFIVDKTIGWAKVMDFIGQVWSAIWNGAMAVFNAFGIVFGAVIKGIDALFQGIVGGWKVLWDAFVGGLQILWTAFAAVVQGVWEGLRVALETIWGGIVTAGKLAWGLIQGAIQIVVDIADTLKSAWDTAAAAVGSIWDGMATAFALVAGAFKKTWDWIVTNIFDPLGKAVGAIGTAWATVWNGAKTLFDTVWNGIKETFTTIVNLIIEGINRLTSGLNAIAHGINFLLDALDKLNPLGYIGGPHIPHVPDIGQIQKIATGGDIESDGLAYLHSGERVVPAAQVDRSRNGQGIGFGGELHFHLHASGDLQYDVNQLGEALSQWLRDRKVVGF